MEGKAKVGLAFALYRGDELVRRQVVHQDVIKIGSDSRSHVCVDDDLAARVHALVEVESRDDITLIDLGNEPGTSVNGKRVNKCKIQTGDRIQVGNTVLVVEFA